MTPNPKRKRASAKGRERQKHACNILRTLGYVTATAGKEMMRLPNCRTISKQEDLFGCIDIVAVKPGSPVLFVQVGTKEMMRLKERECTAFAESQAPLQHCDVEVWGFIAGRRPKGQLFRRTQWDGCEWARCYDVSCVPGSTERAGKAP